MFPTIILGVALLLLYKTIGMPVFAGLALAHCLIGMPYVFRTVLASAQSLDPALEEAGQSLGAGPLRILLLVTLPLRGHRCGDGNAIESLHPHAMTTLAGRRTLGSLQC